MVGIQYLRALAALLVLLFHASQAAGSWKETGTGFWSFGQGGVDLFFVISGFIICHVHLKDIGHPERFTRYLKRRFTRIYPPYWIASLMLLAVALLKPGVVGDEKLAAGSLLESFSLLPLNLLPGLPLLPVGWSLFHEIFFYLFFGMAILMPVSQRGFLVLCGLWALLCCLGFLAGLQPGYQHPAGLLISPHNLQFLAGVALAVLYPHLPALKNSRILELVAAGLLLFLFSPQSTHPVLQWIHTVSLALASTCFLSAVLALEKQQKMPRLPLLSLLGDASYSLYLVHLPVILAVLRFFPGVGTTVLILAGLASGLLFYYLVEKPLLDLFRHRLKTSPC